MSESVDRPAMQSDITAARSDVQAEMAGMKTELRAEMAATRSELKNDIADLRIEMKQEAADTRRHFDVMAEKVEAAVKIVAEVGAHHATVLDDHEARLKSIEKRT